MDKIKIAFDLDGVIIDKPPLIPKKIIEWLFKGGEKDGLHYRFPTFKLEQKIRKLSHFYLLRPPIKENIAFIKKIAREKRYELYIVSGRYSFIEKETWKWLAKRKINNIFKDVYLNTKDEQPHLFKERILKDLKPDIFVDDDDLLADYLAEYVKEVKIFCLFDQGDSCSKAMLINSLQEILKR